MTPTTSRLARGLFISAIAIGAVALPPASPAAAAGMPVQRFGGADRYATAAAVSANHFAPGVPAVFVATGANFPDAPAGGPAAASAGAPILLVTGTKVPTPTVAELTRLRPARIVVLGGPGTTFDLTSLGGRPPWEYADWASTPPGGWMAANAWRYGFVMSYPRNRFATVCHDYEPWHCRYLGRPLAAEQRASGLTLREWLWLRGSG